MTIYYRRAASQSARCHVASLERYFSGFKKEPTAFSLPLSRLMGSIGQGASPFRDTASVTMPRTREPARPATSSRGCAQFTPHWSRRTRLVVAHDGTGVISPLTAPLGTKPLRRSALFERLAHEITVDRSSRFNAGSFDNAHGIIFTPRHALQRASASARSPQLR